MIQHKRLILERRALVVRRHPLGIQQAGMLSAGLKTIFNLILHLSGIGAS